MIEHILAIFGAGFVAGGLVGAVVVSLFWAKVVCPHLDDLR